MSAVTSITTSALAGEQITVVSTGTVREGDLIADRRLYLNGAGVPVEAEDPERAFLLASAGSVIPKEQVEKLGLREEAGRIAWGGMVVGQELTPAEQADFDAIARKNQAALDEKGTEASGEGQEIASGNSAGSDAAPARKPTQNRSKRGG